MIGHVAAGFVMDPFLFGAVAALVVTSMGLVSYIADCRLFDKNGKKLPGSRSVLEKRNAVSFSKAARRDNRIMRELTEVIVPLLGDGNIIGLSFLGKKIVVVQHPDMVKTILTGQYMQYPKAKNYEALKIVIGNGLVTSNGILWRAHRQALSPGFQADELKGMVKTFNQQTRVMMQRWTEAVQRAQREKDSNKTLKGDDEAVHSVVEIDVHRDTSLLTLSVICKCAFGCDFLSDDTEGINNINIDTDQVVADLQDLLLEVNIRNNESPLSTFLRPFLHGARNARTKVASTRLYNAVEKIIDRRAKDYAAAAVPVKPYSAGELEQEKKLEPRPRDLLDIIMLSNERAAKVLTMSQANGGPQNSILRAESSSSGDAAGAGASRGVARDHSDSAIDECVPALFSPQEIRDQCLTFMLAGNDTTSSLVQSVLLELCQHRDVQEKCQAEVDRVMRVRSTEAAPATSNAWSAILEEVSYENIRDDLPYLQQVIKETLRLYPPVSGTVRIALKDTQLGAYTIEPGTQVVISVLGVHTHPDFWSNPKVFDPDRFSEQRIKQTLKHPFQFVPFSAGARNCIGQRFAQMEAVVILTHMLARFEFSMTHAQRESVQYVEAVTYGPRVMKLNVGRRV